VRALIVIALLCGGCASYLGSAHDLPSDRLREPGWVAVHDVPFVAQRAESDCGAAAIAMLVGYLTGLDPAPLADTLRPVPARGLAAGRLRDFARDRGLASFLIHGELRDLDTELTAGRPVLVGLVKPYREGALTHYELVIAIDHQGGRIATLDPAHGLRANSVSGFVAEWRAAGFLTIVAARPSVARGALPWPSTFTPRS
jgi:hypothetical protein